MTVGDAPLEISFASYREEPLDFEITLEEFVIGNYPGTKQPRSYESRVWVTDNTAGTSKEYAITMNKPLLIGGWRIFQSSFDSDGGLNTSILGVSKDPRAGDCFFRIHNNVRRRIDPAVKPGELSQQRRQKPTEENKWTESFLRGVFTDVATSYQFSAGW